MKAVLYVSNFLLLFSPDAFASPRFISWLPELKDNILFVNLSQEATEFKDDTPDQQKLNDPELQGDISIASKKVPKGFKNEKTYRILTTEGSYSGRLKHFRLQTHEPANKSWLAAVLKAESGDKLHAPAVVTFGLAPPSGERLRLAKPAPVPAQSILLKEVVKGANKKASYLEFPGGQDGENRFSVIVERQSPKSVFIISSKGALIKKIDLLGEVESMGAVYWADIDGDGASEGVWLTRERNSDDPPLCSRSGFFDPGKMSGFTMDEFSDCIQD